MCNIIAVITETPDLGELRSYTAAPHYDRFATRADKREGANFSLVHFFAQVTTVLGSEG